MGISETGIASVVTIHDVAFKTFPDMYHGLDRIVYDRKWNYACKHADHIIAISECTKNDIIRFYGVPEEKISVLYQPVNPIYYYNEGEVEAKEVTGCKASNEADRKVSDKTNHTVNKVTDGSAVVDKPYMLYVGSINSRKNLLGIVKAMEMLPGDLQIPLVIVGNGGAYKQQVQQYIADHNMEKLFIWKQIIDNRELKKLYTGASLFVYPSFYEGFGLPVVEALLCGCPVVTSNVSSLPEAAGPASIQIDPNDARAIANGMEKALTDSGLKERMIEEGHRYAMDSFHPTVLARKLMDIYKVTLEKN